MQNLPNLLTLLNLFCGACASVCILSAEFGVAAGFMAGSLAADFLDGLAARALNAQSPLGKELDSLADMVSFGFAPGALLYMLISITLQGSFFFVQVCYPALFAFLITVFSGYRLAKFNLDERQRQDFIGLATPANAVFFMGLGLIYAWNPLGGRDFILQPRFLFALIPVSCWLLTAEIPMFSFKIKQWGWKGNEIKFIFAAAILPMAAFLKWGSPSAIVVLYVALNLIESFLIKWGWLKTAPATKE